MKDSCAESHENNLQQECPGGCTQRPSRPGGVHAVRPFGPSRFRCSVGTHPGGTYLTSDCKENWSKTKNRGQIFQWPLTPRAWVLWFQTYGAIKQHTFVRPVQMPSQDHHLQRADVQMVHKYLDKKKKKSNQDATEVKTFSLNFRKCCSNRSEITAITATKSPIFRSSCFPLIT